MVMMIKVMAGTLIDTNIEPNSEIILLETTQVKIFTLHIVGLELMLINSFTTLILLLLFHPVVKLIFIIILM